MLAWKNKIIISLLFFFYLSLARPVDEVGGHHPPESLSAFSVLAVDGSHLARNHQLHPGLEGIPASHKLKGRIHLRGARRVALPPLFFRNFLLKILFLFFVNPPRIKKKKK
jgi:hypothetical protein